jgi:hypothetical protein
MKAKHCRLIEHWLNPIYRALVKPNLTADHNDRAEHNEVSLPYADDNGDASSFFEGGLGDKSAHLSDDP